jgi:hypothetical protein
MAYSNEFKLLVVFSEITADRESNKINLYNKF